MTWRAGDQAIRVPDEGNLCGFCEDDDRPDVAEGTVWTVAEVLEYPGEPEGLEFVENPQGPFNTPYCACTWRKLDKLEPCEEEFTALVNRKPAKVKA